LPARDVVYTYIRKAMTSVCSSYFPCVLLTSFVLQIAMLILNLRHTQHERSHNTFRASCAGVRDMAIFGILEIGSLMHVVESKGP